MTNKRPRIMDLKVNVLIPDVLVEVTPENGLNTMHSGLLPFFMEIASRLNGDSDGPWRVRFASQLPRENHPFLHSFEKLKVLLDPLAAFRDPIREINSVGTVRLAMMDSKSHYFKDAPSAFAVKQGLLPEDPPQILLSEEVQLSVLRLSADVVQVTLLGDSQVHPSTSVNEIYKRAAYQLSLQNPDDRWQVRYASQVLSRNMPFLHSGALLRIMHDPMAMNRDPIRELNTHGSLILSEVNSRPYYFKRLSNL